MKKLLSNSYLSTILLSIFPALSLYSHNIKESWPIIAVPLILYSIIFGGLSYLIFLIFFRDKHKTSIFTSLWILLFFSYGHLYLFVTENNIFKLIPIGPNSILLAFYLLFLIILFLLLIKNKFNTKKITGFINVVAISLVALNLITIVPYELIRAQKYFSLKSYLSKNKENVKILNNNKETYPDIYYFVFDRYGNEEVLNQYFAFDNSKFLNSLKQKGFFIAEDAYANYPFTLISLSSTLNMQYLNYLSDILGKNYDDQSIVYSQLLQNNKVVDFLKKQGYEYIHFGDSWPPTMENKNAEKNFNKFIQFNEFQLYFYENTLLNTITDKIFSKRIYSGVERLYKKIENFNYRSQKIKETISAKGPKFVFVHLLLPHPPYLFAKDCTAMTFEDVRKRLDEKAYLDQTDCANKLITELIDQIQSKSKRKAAIIIQSDEGPFLPNKYFKNDTYIKNIGDDPYIIHGKILNSYYLPDKNGSGILDYSQLGLTNCSTPVNTFRRIFNYYFDTNYKILDDKSYVYESNKQPYKFIETTNKFKP